MANLVAVKDVLGLQSSVSFEVVKSIHGVVDTLVDDELILCLCSRCL